MAAMSKANARQSGKHKVYYAHQKDVTPVNKAINMARHYVRYGDKSIMDKLKQFPALTIQRAANKMPKISKVHLTLRDSSYIIQPF
jgi:hypothetical protein